MDFQAENMIFSPSSLKNTVERSELANSTKYSEGENTANFFLPSKLLYNVGG